MDKQNYKKFIENDFSNYKNNSLGVFKVFLAILSLVSRKIKLSIISLIGLASLFGIINSFLIYLVPFFINALSGSSLTLKKSSYLPFSENFLSKIANGDGISSLVVIFILLSIFSGLIGVFTMWLRCRIVAAIASELSNKIFYSTISLNYINYKRINSNYFTTILTNNLEISILTIGIFLNLISSLIISILIIFAVIRINAIFFITAVMLIAGFFFLVSKTIKKKILKVSKRAVDLKKKEMKLLTESYSSIKTIILGGNRKFFSRIYFDLVKELRVNQNMKLFFADSPKLMLESLILTGIGVLILYSLKFNPISNLLELLAVLAISLQKLAPELNVIYRAISSLRLNSNDILSINNIFLFNDKNKDIDFDYDKRSLNREKSLYSFSKEITFKNINFAYNNENNVLKDINITFKKNKKIGIIGTTGSGKSTFIDILMGLLPPTSGALFIDGKDLSSEKNFQNLIHWRSSIANVPQDPVILDTTIIENIAFGVKKQNIDFNKVRKAARQARLSEYIENLNDGYFSYAGEKGLNFSGGQRQRLAIARALYNESSILIMDEATSNLDSNVEALIMKSIYEEFPDKTIFIIAHRRSILYGCDEVIEFEKGKIKNIYYPSDFCKIL